MLKLKPCPFCSCTKAFVTFAPEDWFALCIKCKAEGPSASTKEEAVTMWNKSYVG